MRPTDLCRLPALLLLWLALASGAPARLTAADGLEQIRQRVDQDIAEEDLASLKKRAVVYERALPELAKLQRAKSADVRQAAQALRLQYLERLAFCRDPMLRLALETETRITTKTFTAAQWEALPSEALVITSGDEQSTLKTRLEAGQAALVVPHPTETWKTKDTLEASRWDGSMKLVVFHGETRQPGLWARGEGRLFAGPHDDHRVDNVGDLRVKVLICTDVTALPASP